MATLTVGAGQQYSTISAAIAASHDGDVILVQAGTYTNDFATINTKITLQGVGGMVKMVGTENIPNGKGILVTNTDVTIDSFEFTGARVDDGNGAGVRYQGGVLTITNSYFHNNENGILANPVAGGAITIRHSEFDGNGTGDGLTHNIYVNEIQRLTIENSFFHDASVGHQIKSRAQETIVTNTRIYDNSGDSSYSVDLPNGGKATLAGNIIQQGVHGENANVIAFGAEGDLHAGSQLTMTNNIVINDLGFGALLLNPEDAPAAISGSQIFGFEGSLVSGGGVTITGTVQLPGAPALDQSHPWGAPAINTVQGGAAADTLNGAAGDNFIRGAEGNDLITGDAGFDNINGNQGDDTVSSGAGNDWALGGQGADTVSGGDGNDIVNGNIGQDTVDGGTGADTVRGGQGDDILTGGGGNDWLSGDLGSDTISGGVGADVFHGSANAGVDRITDFNAAEGDRVVLDPGTAYQAAQSGADVVITMSGSTIILANVTLGALPAGWIVA